MTHSSDALWCVAAGRAEIRPGALGEGAALVETRASALSRGTERLVFEGRVPRSEYGRMRAPRQEGAFPFPVKYGYAAVGAVTEGPADLLGRRVFALHPHQRRFRAAPEELTPLPDAVPDARAALAANMETALNALWDAEVERGARVAVVGAGLVGCLVARLAARLRGCETWLVDRQESRALTARHLGVRFATPDAAPGDCAAVFHASASEAGLALALDMLEFEGRVVEMSWFGDRAPRAPLGAAFHSRRLAIVSSQVGAVARRMRGRIDHAGRRARAVELLDDPALDALIGPRVRFEDLPARLPDLLAPDAPGVATVIDYS